MPINYADLAVVIILALCVLSSRGRGITHFVFGITSNAISIFLSMTLSGKVSAFLRGTPLFGFLYSQIRPYFSVDSIEEMLLSQDVFSNSSVREQILANDNSEIYKLFGVDKFADYVSNYIANIVLNIISIIAVYFITSLILGALFRANISFSRIPAVRSLNAITGLAGGLIQGIVIIWLLIIILVFFALQGFFLPVYEALLTSRIAIYFYKYNVFMYAILTITA